MCTVHCTWIYGTRSQYLFSAPCSSSFAVKGTATEVPTGNAASSPESMCLAAVMTGVDVITPPVSRWVEEEAEPALLEEVWETLRSDTLLVEDPWTMTPDAVPG